MQRSRRSKKRRTRLRQSNSCTKQSWNHQTLYQSLWLIALCAVQAQPPWWSDPRSSRYRLVCQLDELNFVPTCMRIRIFSAWRATWRRHRIKGGSTFTFLHLSLPSLLILQLSKILSRVYNGMFWRISHWKDSGYIPSFETWIFSLFHHLPVTDFAYVVCYHSVASWSRRRWREGKTIFDLCRLSC